MLPLWVYFLAAFGVCFGAMNDKFWWLTDRLKAIPFRVIGDAGGDSTTFFERMLECSYCTGFHAGWLTYLIYVVVEHATPPSPIVFAGELFVWSLCSTVFCYTADTMTKYLELSTPE